MSLHNAKSVNSGLQGDVQNVMQVMSYSAAENSMEVDTQTSETPQEAPLPQTLAPQNQARPSVGVVAQQWRSAAAAENSNESSLNLPLQTNYHGQTAYNMTSTNTLNQMVPFQVNVNLPQTGSPDKEQLKDEILLLKQQMVEMGQTLFFAQMKQAANSVIKAQFQQRAAEYIRQFQATTVQAQDMWQ